MSKIQSIEEFIKRCDSPEENKNDLVEEIVYTFGNAISNITNGLKYYGYNSSFDDLKKLKSLLLNYKFDLEREDKIREDELKKLELQKQISITNNVSNQSTATATLHSNVTISQTIEALNSIPDNILNETELSDLITLLLSIDKSVKTGDNEGFKEKAKTVLKTVADKGFDLFVAFAPYLLQAGTTFTPN